MHINFAYLENNKQPKIYVMNNFQAADYRDLAYFTYWIKHNI